MYPIKRLLCNKRKSFCYLYTVFWIGVMCFLYDLHPTQHLFMITYTKFYDNYMNQSEDINKKTLKNMLFESCIVGCGRVWLGSKWVKMGHSGS